MLQIPSAFPRGKLLARLREADRVAAGVATVETLGPTGFDTYKVENDREKTQEFLRARTAGPGGILPVQNPYGDRGIHIDFMFSA